MTDQTTKHDDERAEVDRQLHYWYEKVQIRCERNPLCSDHEAAEIRVIVNGLRTRYSALTNGKAWHPGIAALALAAFLAFTQLPAGCTQVYTFEDGGIIATCGELGSKVIVYDADGQPFENDAGVPVREPGWYAIS